MKYITKENKKGEVCMIDNYARNVIDKFEYSEAKEFYYFDQIPFEKCTRMFGIYCCN